MSSEAILQSTVKQKKKNSARLVYLIHSATGLWLTLLLSVVLITGTLTVFAVEIDWLMHSEMRVEPGETRVNPGILFDQVKKAYPNAGINGIETAAMLEHRAAGAFMTVQGGGFRMAWVNQFNGQVTGDTPFMMVGRFIDIMHTTLFLPVIGRAFVNFFGVMMLISIVTGLLTYKKFWKGFFRKPRFEKKSRTWLGDLHRLVALWSVWFLAIIGFTGAWWFYENPLVESAGAPHIVAERPDPPTLTTEELNLLGPETPTPMTAENIVDIVQEKFPDMKIIFLSAPANASQPFMVRGDRGEALVMGGANTVYVNPYTGEIMGSRMSEDWTFGQRFDAAMHPLHYGTWAKSGTADFIVKLIWFIGGAVASFLAISGLLIYFKRTKEATRELVSESTVFAKFKRVWRWIRPWGGPMKGFKYVNLLGIAGILSGAVLVISLGAQGVGDKGTKFPVKRVGDFDVSLTAIAGFLEANLNPIRPGAKVEVFPNILENRFRDARFIRIGVTDASGKDSKGAVVEGPEGIAHVDVHLPEKLDNAKVWLEIEGWDGKAHREYWLLRES